MSSTELPEEWRPSNLSPKHTRPHSQMSGSTMPAAFHSQRPAHLEPIARTRTRTLRRANLKQSYAPEHCYSMVHGSSRIQNLQTQNYTLPDGPTWDRRYGIHLVPFAHAPYIRPHPLHIPVNAAINSSISINLFVSCHKLKITWQRSLNLNL